MRLYISLLTIFLITNCSKKENENTHVISTNQYFEYNYSDFFSRIITRTYNNSTDIITEQINDSVYCTVNYDYLQVPYKKEYWYIDSTNKAYKTIDSIAESYLIIAEYNYTYNEEGFVIHKLIQGKMYNLISEELEYEVTGDVLYTIENGNTTQAIYERSFIGTENYTEREIHTFTYTNTLNSIGLQGFTQPFLGKSNTHLINTETYEFYKNTILQEKGEYTYSYILEDSLIQEEVRLYTPENENEYSIRTHSFYTKINE